MSVERKKTLRDVMSLAWQMVKMYGISLSESLRKAWKNIKLKIAMQSGIVEFHFVKTDGTIRQAFGTLQSNLVPVLVGSQRKRAEYVQVFFDTEKQEWRSFKKINLI